METRLLDSQWPKAARRGDTVKARIWQEERLVPYVVANLSAFPELLAEPFVFVNLRPVRNALLEDVFRLTDTAHSLQHAYLMLYLIHTGL
jgi:hypothetical protein